ncbi:MAG TPA: HAMP domain-containing sensor histidine kinase [Streptosporangiaceae bacterium]|nr:HAMP domain-containing sensor histidine kinase [Streptosporangiaceae bacterium]
MGFHGWHPPRRSLRVRLALACWGVFVVTGIPLLAVTVGLWQGATGSASGSGSASAAGPGPAPASGRVPGPGGSPAPGVPRHFSGHRAGSIQVAQHSFDLHQLLVVSAIALVIMTVPAIIIGWLVAGRLLLPLRAMTTAARNISAINLHERLRLSGPDDEIKQLGDTFDGLLGRLERSFQAQRQFVANASHELRTPHATMRVWLEVALGKPQPAPPHIADLGDRLHHELDHIDRLLDGLLVLARAQQPAAADEATLPLDTVVCAATAERAALISGQGLEVRHQECPAARVTGSEMLLARMVSNVVDNAITHNAPGGWVRITTEAAGGSARLVVENGGPVLDERAVQALTQPFRRLGPERTGSDRGSGLGLSIVSAIAEMHGGRLELHALAEGGFQVVIELPLAVRAGAGVPA